jgi:predicted DCC family thiol-disulfide oxidoreductase YuxK
MENLSKKPNALRVSNLPPKPLVLFDGDCGFCRQWVGRWKALTADQVLYEPYQKASDRFPEIDPQRFTRSLQLIETDGLVSQGAEAVFKSLQSVFCLRWLRWCYVHVPGFAGVSEWGYRKIAENRHRVWLSKPCCKH